MPFMYIINFLFTWQNDEKFACHRVGLALKAYLRSHDPDRRSEAILSVIRRPTFLSHQMERRTRVLIFLN